MRAGGTTLTSDAVALDDVGHVVTHHAAEPAHLVALVAEVVSHVGGRGHADVVVRFASRPASRRAAQRRLDRPVDDEGIGQLQDQAVGL